MCYFTWILGASWAVFLAVLNGMPYLALEYADNPPEIEDNPQ